MPAGESRGSRAVLLQQFPELFSKLKLDKTSSRPSCRPRACEPNERKNMDKLIFLLTLAPFLYVRRAAQFGWLARNGHHVPAEV